MDKHGYFNYSVNTGVAGPIVQNADVVIVEVNEHMPKIHGGYGECIHVSEVDYICLLYTSLAFQFFLI